MSREFPQSRQERSVIDLAVAVWRRRVLCGVIAVLPVVVAVVYGLLAEPRYRADVVVVQREGGSLPANLAQLGGLASLAGINLSSSEESAAPVAVLKSKGFAREFIESEKLLPVLLARSGSKNNQPDIREAVKYFDERVRTVVEDKRTGLLVVSMSWFDPTVSAEWANRYIARANERLRGEALTEAEGNVVFLKQQLQTGSVPALQQSVSEVMKREMQRLVLAQGNLDFAFKVVDKATPPLRRLSPRRSLLAGMGFLLGILMSLTTVLVLESVAVWRRSRELEEAG